MGSTKQPPQPYRYFIAFAFLGGNGNTQVDLAKPIRTIADVQYVEKLLRGATGQTVISVTGWQRFED